ncbi:probable leucine-rich repeat receptor-like protein kinase At1g68400 [Humulus lupulus]|uniref:probable leucine-rich repeat receptor-like protein kinase At1g68400 n=1 Tax=Humulus lupulus TaxID=3486 RepID=UPI002B40175A|nr:probable leucine-rich repeat receptor-like protein kinase At1g68400 [Humulus lupulus]
MIKLVLITSSILKLNLLLLLVLRFSSSSSSSSTPSNDYYPEERDALIELRDFLSSNADLHKKWTGPPCIQNDTKWVGVLCSNGHVVHLTLEGIQLKGTLPPTFLHNITFLTKLSFKNNSITGPLPNLTNLIHLQYVFLSHNNFWGPIPMEFTQLPDLNSLELQDNLLYGQIPPFDQSTLTVFNVSNNHLSGQIPNTSVLHRFPRSCFDHNSDLCGIPLEIPCLFSPPSLPPPPPPNSPPSTRDNDKKSTLKKWSIVGLIITAAALVSFIVIIGFLCCYKIIVQRKEAKKGINAGMVSNGFSESRMTSPESSTDPEKGVDLEFFDKQMPAFDLDDLLRSSAEVLGKGSLGTTYQTTLETGQRLVVKRLNNMNELGKKEFVQQMQLLGKTRHANLVQIVSFYYSKDEKLVIYEFVPHGTLFELLHEKRGIGRAPLNWGTRLSIIKDIAKGLNFLHQSLPHHRVPHANLKSTNVLIHQHHHNFHSKLTDFGFFPLILDSRSSSSDQKLAATRSPEYAHQRNKFNKLSRKADVYCFGVIILEIITGKIPGEISPMSDDTTTRDLSDWVRAVVNRDWSTDILDVEIVSAREGHDEMLKLTEVALECTDERPEKRPKMSEVLVKIEEIELQHRERNCD